MSDKRASEVISEARNVLFERGWTRGTFENERGEVCIRGALSIGSCGNAKSHAWGNAATPFVAEAIGRSTFFCWNDAPQRTFDEVIDALDKAEKIALIAEESDG